VKSATLSPRMAYSVALSQVEQDARKARGAFFTPPAMATFLAQWAIRQPTDSVFEPSCGEAAFLTEAVARLRDLGASAIAADQIQGVDIDGPSVGAARSLLTAIGAPSTLTTADFFDLRVSQKFDAVIGNPPYVRYQAFAGAARTKGLEAALAQGVRLTGLASSWASFVVHATSLLAPAGRLALVLPAELLSVNYAAPVRRFLMQRFGRVRLVLFEERVFPGVMEEVVLLLAEGDGPTDHCDLLQVKNLSALVALDGQKWTPADAEHKWVTGLLRPDAAAVYAQTVNGPGFSTLLDWGETSLGMVTGNNQYFALSATRARELNLKSSELMKICPPGSRHLRGLGFFEKAWDDMRADGAAVYLFDPSTNAPSDAARAYVEVGEKAGVNAGYKCRMRSPWWRVPRVSIPDAFLTCMNHDTPRIVANRAEVEYLNSIHGVTFHADRRQIAMDLLPIAALNSVTVLASELVGRSYGGGMLKIEPKEGDRLPVPSLAIVEAAAAELRMLRPQLATGLRQGKLLKVTESVDRVLRSHLNLTHKDLQQLRVARAMLFSRRVTRSRRSE
jgi:adenine-specific DNA-methyltransferase